MGLGWDISEDSVIIDGLNFDTVTKVTKKSNKDPFKKSWSDLRSHAGLQKNFKRREDRLERSDMPQGQCGGDEDRVS